MAMAIEEFLNQEAIGTKLKDLTELYFVVKEVIIYFEEVNPEQKTDIQPINELRNAFDHLMRCTASWYGINNNHHGNEQLPDYVSTHLDKSFGHVYRAGYDTVDFLALTVKELIVKDLDGYSVETIKTIIPGYFSDIKPDIITLIDDITEFRKQKDVAITNSDHLIDYIKRIKGVVGHHKKITALIPQLDELERKLSSERKRKEVSDWLKRIAVGVLLVLIGWVIGSIF